MKHSKIKNREKLSKRQWEMLVLALMAILLFSAGFLFFIPTMQNKVRAAQVESVIFHVSDKSKVKVLSYGKLQNQVTKKEKSVLLFVPETSEYYEEFLTLLQDDEKTTAFKGNVYFYPFVYDTPQDFKNLRLDSHYAAVISYENGEQLARKTFKTREDMNNVIREINQLF